MLFNDKEYWNDLYISFIIVCKRNYINNICTYINNIQETYSFYLKTVNNSKTNYFLFLMISDHINKNICFGFLISKHVNDYGLSL